MNTTLKQQIKATQKAYRASNDITLPKQSKHTLALNDACSTLAAVALMEDQIKALPELIKICTTLNKQLGNGLDTFETIGKLNTLLNKLKS